jgi:hypothetical protein
MIPVPYILLYSYLRSIYYFRMRINLTVRGGIYVLGKQYYPPLYKSGIFYHQTRTNRFRTLING